MGITLRSGLWGKVVRIQPFLIAQFETYIDAKELGVRSMNIVRRIAAGGLAVIVDSTVASRWLLKILIPVAILTKVAQGLGLIALLAQALEVPMSVFGLPGSTGIVWATAMLSGLFPAVLVYASIAADSGLTVAQVSVLASLLLIAHSLPTEVTVASCAGIPARVTLLLRIGAAVVYAYLLHATLESNQLLQATATMLPFPTANDPGLLAWAIAEVQRMLLICATVYVLHLVMAILEAAKITELVAVLLTPPLRMLGICPKASSILITGFVMGIAVGGAMIVKEANSGEICRKDVFGALTLLGMFHSVVDDTLLMMAVGADISGIFWGRLLFVLLLVALIMRVHQHRDFFQRMLFWKQSGATA